MAHYYVIRIASWVILFKYEPEADDVVVADQEKIRKKRRNY
jgi:hypothetical protein